VHPSTGKYEGLAMVQSVDLVIATLASGNHLSVAEN